MINEKLEEVLIQELSYFRMVLQGSSGVSKNLLREYTRENTYAETILDEPFKIALKMDNLTGYAYNLTDDRTARDYESDVNDVRMRWGPAKKRNTRLFSEGIRDNVGWYIEIPG